MEKNRKSEISRDCYQTGRADGTRERGGEEGGGNGSEFREGNIRKTRGRALVNGRPSESHRWYE